MKATRLSVAALCAAVVIFTPAPAAAQEVQVAFDDAGRLERIDAELARRLGMFLDRWPDLREVRLFSRPDGRFVLEVTSLRAGTTVRERVEMSAAEAAELRAQVAARMAEEAVHRIADQDGRFLLLGASTALGVAYYGWALPSALDLQGKGAVATYMLTAAGSFFIPYLLTHDREVTWGMANASLWGGTRGILHGFLVHRLIAGGRPGCDLAPPPPPERFSGDCSAQERHERAGVASGMVVSLAEGVAGHRWAARSGMSAGTANTIGLGGDAGTIFAGLSLLLFDIDGERAVPAVVLGGAAAGLTAGHAYAARRDHTWGDAAVLAMTGGLGLYGAAMVADWLDLDSERPIAAALMLGGGAGLLTGDRLVRKRDFTPGQAILVQLGTVAGGLLGAGVAYLVTSEDSDNATPYLTLSMLGATGGYAFTFASVDRSARQRAGGRRALDVRVDPAGVLGLLPVRAPGGVGGPVTLPLVSASYRF